MSAIVESSKLPEQPEPEGGNFRREISPAPAELSDDAPGAENTKRNIQNRKSSRVVVPHAPRWFQRLGAWAVRGLEQAITTTLRPEWNERTGMFDPARPAQPVIFCIWHNRLALAMWLYRRHPRHHQPQRRMAALVSASKDGAFLAAILESFGVQPVRGSSSRRGPRALLELIDWAGRGYDLAITPDGPRGPRYTIQDGVLAAAQFTGLPILPVGCWLERKWTLKSWDAFQVPQPFTRCEVHVGEVLRVPREVTGAERESFRAELLRRMLAVTRD